MGLAPPPAAPVPPPTGWRAGYAKIKAFVDALIEYWKLVVAVVVLLAILFPFLYGLWLRCAPKAYYQIGIYGAQTGDPHLDWTVNLNDIDQAAPDQWLTKILAIDGDLVRPPKDGYVPGRAFPPNGKEQLGREWRDPKCLFVTDIVLEAISRRRIRGHPYAEPFPATGDAKRDQYLVVTASDLKKKAGAGSAEAYYRANVLPAITAPCHDAKADGPLCPKVAIWAKGTVASCSLSFKGL